MDLQKREFLMNEKIGQGRTCPKKMIQTYCF
jgi:hypothetical protein